MTVQPPIVGFTRASTACRGPFVERLKRQRTAAHLRRKVEALFFQFETQRNHGRRCNRPAIFGRRRIAPVREQVLARRCKEGRVDGRNGFNCNHTAPGVDRQPQPERRFLFQPALGIRIGRADLVGGGYESRPDPDRIGERKGGAARLAGS